MTFKLGQKTPPPGAPKKVQLKFPGEIRAMIIHGRKLFAIKSTVDRMEFDYRVWISEYRETHIVALINSQSLQLGELIPNSDGYCEFVTSALTSVDSEDDIIALAGFAQSMFQTLWKSVDCGCKVPSNLEVWVYE